MGGQTIALAILHLEQRRIVLFGKLTQRLPGLMELRLVCLSRGCHRRHLGLEPTDQHPLHCRLDFSHARTHAPIQPGAELRLAFGQEPRRSLRQRSRRAGRLVACSR